VTRDHTVTITLDTAQFDALHAEADRRGLPLRAILRQGVELVTGEPSAIPIRSRLAPISKDRRRLRGTVG
jgi:hypothetical protein